MNELRDNPDGDPAVLDIVKIEVGLLMTNAYLLSREDADALLLIDPGGSSDKLISRINETGKPLGAMICTHGHADHIAATTALRNEYPDAEILIHPADRDMLTDPKLNLSEFMGMATTCPPTDRVLEDGQADVHGFRFTVLHTPGHTPGGISLYFPDDKTVFCGDTLFEMSIGRTDLPGGDSGVFQKSITETLFHLPDDTVVCPGHGQDTSIGREKNHNPFV